MKDRAVLALEGGQPGDLDFRFKMNAVFRSTLNATAKNATLRRSQKARVSFEDTRTVPVSALENLLESIAKNKSILRAQIKQLYTGIGKPVPSRYQLGSDSPPAPAVFNPFEVLSQKEKKSLATIQALEEAEKKLAQKEEEWHSNVISATLTEKTLQNAASSFAMRQKRAQAAEYQSARSEGRNVDEETLSRISDGVVAEAPLPKILPPVVGIEISYHSGRDILPTDYDRLAAFIERHPDESRWFAPQECRSPEGTLLPLSHEMENLCLKNLRVKDSKALAHLEKNVKEALAWRWLIISHNHVNKDARVKLSPKLTISYERSRAKVNPNVKATEQMESVRSLVEEFIRVAKTPTPTPDPAVQQEIISASAVGQLTTQVWDTLLWTFSKQMIPTDDYRIQARPEFAHVQPIADRWNAVFESADALLESRKLPEVQSLGAPLELDKLLHRVDEVVHEPASEGSVADSAESWQLLHPEFIERDGTTFFRNDIELLDITEGQEFRTVVHEGVEYYSIIGTPAGPALSAKSKGKKPLRPAASSKEKSPKRATAVKSKEASQSPIQKENPLGVKGEPKSASLSESQRATLRKFFNLEEGVIPSDVWSRLSNKERQAEMAKRSIPRWASESVLRSPSNLQLILEGKLTRDNANKAARSLKVGASKATSQAMEAWQQLKHDFKGTPLFRNPATSKEKAFKKRFDQLVADYGQQPCFPKLRERPDQQGRSPSRGRKPTRSEGGDFLQMAKAFGEIARAFSGK
jgi:hypothetical protein